MTPGTTTIMLIKIGVGTRSDLREIESIKAVLNALIKAVGLRSHGKEHVQMSAPAPKEFFSMAVMRAVRGGYAVANTFPDSSLLEITISSDEHFTAYAIQEAMMPFSKWAILVDVCCLQKRAMGWSEADVALSKSK